MEKAEKLNSHWDDDASGYDSLRNTWLNQRRDIYVHKFLEKAKEGEYVFELGSGTGSSLIWLATQRPDLHFVGIEPLRNYCEFAGEKARQCGLTNIEFLCGYGEESEKHYGKRPRAQWIISTDVLHHVNDLTTISQQVSSISQPGAQWLSFEPSCLNPYNFYFQATTVGERNFWLADFIRASRNFWELKAKDHITIIPSFIPNPSPILKKVESILEGLPIVCGRRVFLFERTKR